MTAAAVPIPDAPPDLGYRYEFAPDELEAIAECTYGHGFAVVKSLLAHARVEELKRTIREAVIGDRPLAPGETRFCTDFIEHAPPLWRLLEDRAFMAIYERLLGTDDIVVHRTAALAKSVGAPVNSWHTDQQLPTDRPQSANEVLNTHEFPNGAWFYLNGTHPSRGGLAVIADSHAPDWPGPVGFELAPDRKTFYRRGEQPHAHEGMDVPGMVPLFTDPGDMVLFAARTYHGVYPHRGAETRLSCAIVMRPRSHKVEAPWGLTDSAKRFLRELPPHLKRYAEGYVGLDRGWTPQP